ncbi:Delta(1)-pyrroline-2-carboxylate reductase [Pseudoalteromonas holothuriae]|uniref:Delta(1)-pyrroline-2-carboxylate reductase n=1 Tax=Pseudoalteromonas holothuriae TaxID=2963714 RepID=A0ABM9GHP5_9GAMM|nr:ornithine cyclodeaminase family protein [Pseudoalteromonas sp. CIP111951]CAH9058310.1 Delta(1)-pyrroline-2-carboxylate reductase [Pseudoalteromonas sp. CIP111951]
MQVITEEQVHRCLSFKTLIESLKLGFSMPAGTPPRHVYELDSKTHDAFAVLPAWNEQYIAVKAFTYFPNNAEQGYQSLYSKLMLFKRDFGEPLALIDGSSVTLWRTAAVSALASQYLSRTDARHLVFFGSGNLAEYMIKAHISVRPIEKVTIIARNTKKAEQLCSCLSTQYKDVEFFLGVSDEQTLASADIVSCATGSATPLFDGAWLSPGTHIDLIGNHHKNARECDSATITRSAVFVDSKVNVLNEAGELLIPISEGEFDARNVVAQLSEMNQLNYVRDKEQITLFKSVGMALSDLLSAGLVYRLNC